MRIELFSQWCRFVFTFFASVSCSFLFTRLLGIGLIACIGHTWGVGIVTDTGMALDGCTDTDRSNVIEAVVSFDEESSFILLFLNYIAGMPISMVFALHVSASYYIPP